MNRNGKYYGTLKYNKENSGNKKVMDKGRVNGRKIEPAISVDRGGDEKWRD